MANLCMDCADCLAPANPNDPLQSGVFRCGSPNAVGAHHEPMGEAPRPFGVEVGNAPACEVMRTESPVFPTCGPAGKWFRSAKMKADGDAKRHLDSVAALAKKEDADRKAAASASE